MAKVMPKILYSERLAYSSSTSTRHAALFSAKVADCRVVQGPTRTHLTPVWNQAKVTDHRHFMVSLHWVRHAVRVSLWCHSGVTLVASRCHSGCTLDALWMHAGVSLESLGCHS